MNYDATAMFREAALVAARGWKLVRLYGVRDDLKCTCGKENCVNAGKHPIGENWHLRATDDEDTIARWFDNVEEHSRVNVGVRLGATSGIIDVEYDSPDAEQAIVKYGLDLIDTPAYSSGRGVHRIFQHEDWMPNSAVLKVEGIEVRVGGGGAASQSVIPVSLHKTGKNYQWLPGRSPEEISPAKLPAAFREAIIESSRRQTSGAVARARRVLQAGKKLGEGDRHDFLLGVASRQAGRVLRFTEAEQAEIVQILLCVNEVMCSPPKGEAEVIKLAQDQFNYYQQRAIAKKQESRYRYESYGLVWNPEDNCWEPGSWRLTKVRSEPAEYLLKIPHPNPKSDEVMEVRMTIPEWSAPARVATKIHEASAALPGWPSIDMNIGRDDMAKWTAAWNGGDNDSGQEIPGLKKMLYDDADEIIPPKGTSLTTYRAEILLAAIESLAKAHPGEEPPKPKKDGKPQWIESKKGEWRLWLVLNPTIEWAWERRKAGKAPNTRERNALRNAIIAVANGKKIKCNSVVLDGTQKKFEVWTEEHIEALRVLADAV